MNVISHFKYWWKTNIEKQGHNFDHLKIGNAVKEGCAIEFD